LDRGIVLNFSFPEVTIYDSLYESVDDTTLTKLKELLGENTTVKMVTASPKQNGFVDCGLYAIATCVSLAYGKQPSRYLQNFMRTHLIITVLRIICLLNFLVFGVVKVDSI